MKFKIITILAFITALINTPVMCMGRASLFTRSLGARQLQTRITTTHLGALSSLNHQTSRWYSEEDLRYFNKAVNNFEHNVGQFAPSAEDVDQQVFEILSNKNGIRVFADKNNAVHQSLVKKLSLPIVYSLPIPEFRKSLLEIVKEYRKLETQNPTELTEQVKTRTLSEWVFGPRPSPSIQPSRFDEGLKLEGYHQVRKTLDSISESGSLLGDIFDGIADIVGGFFDSF